MGGMKMSGRENGKGSGWRFFPAGSLLAGLLCLAVSCGAGAAEPARDVAARFAEERPAAWGMDLPGILRRVPVEVRVVALTFDACGGAGRGRDDYDRRLIAFLESERIPATLFLNLRWIRAHPETARALAGNPLFEIGNHGAKHRPLSVSGRRAYGIRGTASAAEAVEEVEAGIGPIMAMTGRRPLFFRSGTAHYDDVALRILEALGCRAAGFSVNGDEGGTLSAGAVRRRLLSVRPGDIVLCHMNRPASGTAEGVRQAVPELLRRGFRFVTLEELLSLERGRSPGSPNR